MNNRRKEALAALTTADWRALVYRELQADNWYAQPVIEAVPDEQTSEVVEEAALPLAASANGNGAALKHPGASLHRLGRTEPHRQPAPYRSTTDKESAVSVTVVPIDS